MSQPYQRRSPNEWSTLVNAQQQSGLSAVQYCKQNNIVYASFCKWKQRLTDHESFDTDTPASGFLDLSSIAPSSGRWDITLSLGDGIELTLSRT